MATRYNPARGRNRSLVGGGGYTPFSAGRKAYGSGRPFPNLGKTADQAGYNEREAKNKARRNAILRRIGGNQ